MSYNAYAPSSTASYDSSRPQFFSPQAALTQSNLRYFSAPSSHSSRSGSSKSSRRFWRRRLYQKSQLPVNPQCYTMPSLAPIPSMSAYSGSSRASSRGRGALIPYAQPFVPQAAYPQYPSSYSAPMIPAPVFPQTPSSYYYYTNGSFPSPPQVHMGNTYYTMNVYNFYY